MPVERSHTKLMEAAPEKIKTCKYFSNKIDKILILLNSGRGDTSENLMRILFDNVHQNIKVLKEETTAFLKI